MSNSVVVDHIARGASNEALAVEIAAKIPNTDWPIVVNFYAALHYLEAYLCTKHERFHAKRHDDRKTAIRNSTELPSVFRSHYSLLQDVSEQVRYDEGFMASDEVAASCTWLGTIKNSICPKLVKKGYKA